MNTKLHPPVASPTILWTAKTLLEVVLVVVAQVVERSLDDGDMTHIIGIFWDSERDFIVIFWDFHGDFMELFLTNNMRGFFFCDQ
jgi:hypothetical protein